MGTTPVTIKSVAPFTASSKARKPCSSITVPIPCCSICSNTPDSTAIPEPAHAPLRPEAEEAHAQYSAGTLAVHGGEREGRPRVSDSLTTPIVQTSTYTFRDTAELIAYQEGTFGSYEYGR